MRSPSPSWARSSTRASSRSSPRGGSSAAKAEPPLHLVVIGDGPDLRPYARRAADDGWLWRNVSFLGPLPHHEAIAAVAACDIGYSECWSEAGFPAKLFEYMALGKPIVVEGKPQLGEVLEERPRCVLLRNAG